MPFDADAPRLAIAVDRLERESNLLTPVLLDVGTSLDDGQSRPSSSGKVFALNAGLRLRRETSLKSTMYERVAEQLDNASGRQLQILEAMLFSAGLGVDCCEDTDDFQPIGHFWCSFGTIWFFFSHSGRYFTLLGFELATGGGHYLPLTEQNSPSGGRFPHRISVSGRRGIAAALAVSVGLWTFLVAVRSIGMSILSAALPYGWTSRAMGAKTRCSYADGIELDEMRSLLELLSANGRQRQLRLPAWSILSRQVQAPQQLENGFARNIVAGELICRCVEMVAGPLIAVTGDNHGYRSNQLPWRVGRLATETFIRAYRNSDARRRGVVWLSDSDAAIDIASARAEVALLLSASLVRSRRRVAERSHVGMSSDMLTRFASFAEFVVLSRSVIERSGGIDKGATFDGKAVPGTPPLAVFMGLRERCHGDWHEGFMEECAHVVHTDRLQDRVITVVRRLSDTLREVDARMSLDTWVGPANADSETRLTDLACRILSPPDTRN